MTRSLLLAALAIPAFAADYSVDDDHTFALFRVQHMGAGFTWGRFDAIGGEVSYDPANTAGNKVSLTIQAASVSVGVPKPGTMLIRLVDNCVSACYTTGYG